MDVYNNYCYYLYASSTSEPFCSSSKKIEWVKFDHATKKNSMCWEKMVKHLWRGEKTASRDGSAQATSLNHKVGTHEGKADVGTGRALRSRASAKASDLRRELHPQALFIKFSFRFLLFFCYASFFYFFYTTWQNKSKLGHFSPKKTNTFLTALLLLKVRAKYICLLYCQFKIVTFQFLKNISSYWLALQLKWEKIHI